MRKVRFYIAFYIAKFIQGILKILKRNATYFPGKVAIKLCPYFLEYISKPNKIIAVTGTNGKTTVCNMINDVLIDNGYDVLNNRLGSNINSGIASAFLANNNLCNKTKKEIAVLEVDERSSILIYKYVKPTYLLCTNLFRDSIKRNAHTDFIVDVINKALPKETKLILNADDLISCKLGAENEKVYFGIDKLETDIEETSNLIRDIKTCPKCDTQLKYEYARYHHIGKAYCPNCEFKSPNSDYLVTNIDKENKEVTVLNHEQEYKYHMIADSVFNIYNLVATIVVLIQIGLAPEKINESLKKIKILKTRLNEEIIDGIHVITHMTKRENPVAASRVFDYVKSEKGNKAVILMVDDNRDAKISSENTTWLYDADFELLNDESIKQIVIGGVRSSDHFLRFLIAGVDKEKLNKIEDELKTIDLIKKENIDKLFILHDMNKYNIALKLKQKMKGNV